MKKKIIKIGFDLDGVILYNPIRVFRGLAKKFLKPLKSTLLHQNKSAFYMPKSQLEKFLWILVHKTSFKINNGFEDLKKLSKNKNIKLYIITGRYSFLKNDFNQWIKKIKGNKVFNKCYLNSDDLQPNEFKEKMIKKLKLDVYVEDNFDIIEKLNHHTKAKILWLSNIADKNISYNLKFFSLKEVCQYLRKSV